MPGTYIRTLAQDIARAGCYAHLAALRRTVGPFSLDRAVTLDALQAMPDPSSSIACIERIAGGPAAFQTLKDSL